MDDKKNANQEIPTERIIKATLLQEKFEPQTPAEEKLKHELTDLKPGTIVEIPID